MRKARVSLLAGGSLLTTWRRAVSLAASSGMSVAVPGSSVRGEAVPSPSLTWGPLLTSSLQEGRVEAEGDQWFLESPQKVLEHPAHHVDVSHSAEGRQRSPGPQQLPLPLPHQLLRAWHPVQPCLGHRKKGSAPGNHSIATFTILAPTSVKPRFSTSVTHCTTSVGTRGGVEGAKSASTPWGEQCQSALCPPASPAARVGRGQYPRASSPEAS